MEENNLKTEDLVLKARGGDPEAFAILYERYYKELYKTAYFTLGNVQDAENAVSETVLDAYAGIAKLRDPSAFRAWIFAILSNKCKAILREYVKSRTHLAERPPEEFEEVLGDEDPEIQGAEDKSALQKAFAVLTEEERQIVTMTVYAQLDSGQIAKQLSVNRNTVRSKYSRALKKMRMVLEE